MRKGKRRLSGYRKRSSKIKAVRKRKQGLYISSSSSSEDTDLSNDENGRREMGNGTLIQPGEVLDHSDSTSSSSSSNDDY